MCGIAGFAGFANIPETEARRRVARMVASILHRGPDEQRAVLFPSSGAALGCARLSLVDVDHGSQPISNEDGSVWVVLNGEIYNYLELRRELISRGHRFRNESDTEVLAHLYEEHGDAMFARLNGMFAIAVWDRRERKLLLARDHAGMKPLYYTQGGDGGIAFASEARALFAAAFVEPEADWEQVATYLNVGYVPAPSTPFKRVEKLPLGVYRRWQDGRSSTHRFWSPPPLDPSSGDATAPTRLDDLLRQAVADHLQGDVPVGCFLSGGWDSSIIAAVAQERVGNLKTFTIIFPDSPGQDEGPHARAVAQSLGTEHHEIEYRASMLPELLERAAWQLEEPHSTAPYVLWSVLSGLAASRVKAVVSGEGSDELFAGYPWLAPSRLYRMRELVPSWAALGTARFTRDPVLKRKLRRVGTPTRDDLDFEFVRRGTLDEVPVPARVPRHGMDGSFGYSVVADQLGVAAVAAATDHLQRRLLLEYGGRLTGAILALGDRMSMTHSLEVRMPFLDRRVVEFAMRLPTHWKRSGAQEKAILKPMVKKYAPVVLARRKQGLQVLSPSGPSPAFREFARAALLGTGSIFPRRPMERALRDAFDRDPPATAPVTTTLHLQLWYDAFIAPGSRGRTIKGDPNLPVDAVSVTTEG